MDPALFRSVCGAAALCCQRCHRGRIDVNKPNGQRSEFDIPATVNTVAEAQVIQQLIKTYVSISPSDVSREIAATLMSPREGSNIFSSFFSFFFFLLFDRLDFFSPQR